MYKTEMFKKFQQTIAKKVCFEGIGLHSGRSSKITLNPGKEDQGIIFKRTDLHENNKVVAKFSNVSSARLCTTIENEHGVKVSTIEHLLAALYICDIDNVEIEINSEEVPIMDGSAKDFVDVLKNTEKSVLNQTRKYLKITEKFVMLDSDKKISIEPCDSLKVKFQLNYKNKIIAKQKNEIDLHGNILKDVYEARTFCLFEDIEKIKNSGLAKGGSLENAIVVKKDEVLNKDGLRNKKEFVNHKILDLAGDFILSGYRILGKVNCYQGGHQLTNTFLRSLMEANSNYFLAELEDLTPSKEVKVKQFHKIAVNA
tara:strand:- start:815 stop:1753 length:939 start_codon:yes stop_codon:yes gene_type:complete